MSLKIKENNTTKDLAGQPLINHGTDVDNSLNSVSTNALNERVIYNEISNIDTSVLIPDLSDKMPYSSTDAIENEGTNLKVAADTIKEDFISQIRDTSSFEATSPLTAGTNVTINNNTITGTMGGSPSKCVCGTYFDNQGSTGSYEAAKYAFTSVNAESANYVDSVNVIYVNNDKLGTTFRTGQRLYLYFPTTLTTSYSNAIWLSINGKRNRVRVVSPTGLKEWKPSSLLSNSIASQNATRTNDPLGYDYYYDKNPFSSSESSSIFGESNLPCRCITYYGSWSDSSWETAVLRQDVTTSYNIIAQAGTFLELYPNGSSEWVIKGNPLVASIPYYLYNMAGSSGLRFRTDVGEPSTTQYFAHLDYYANGYFELKGYIPILGSSTATQDSGVGSSQAWFMYFPINGSRLDKEMTSVIMQDYGSTTAENNTAYNFGTANTDVSSSSSVASATQNELHTFNYGGLSEEGLAQRPRLRFFHDRYTMGRFFSIKGYLK